MTMNDKEFSAFMNRLGYVNVNGTWLSKGLIAATQK